MVSKRKRFKSPYNIYAGGGWSSLGSIDKASAITGGVGNLVNTIVDSTKIKDTTDIEDSIKDQSNTKFSANSTDALMSEWDSMSTLEHVNWKDLKTGSIGGKAGLGALSGAGAGSAAGPWGALIGGVAGGLGGLFGGIGANAKAKRTAGILNRKIDKANVRALNAFQSRAENVDTQKDINIAANFSANGGYLFKDGGGIHIKKKNRGKFTEYCGGKVTNECIQKGLHSSNPATRKRANFARNARGWHHAFGGELGTNGTDFTNGVTTFNVGGTHEENPNQGILQGLDANGVPNLVEEGEIKYNDYIFSNRIKAKKGIVTKLGLPKSDVGKTYARLAERASEESKERPNDPISKNGLENSMLKLQIAQESQREEKGGNKFGKGGNLYAEGDFLQFTPKTNWRIAPQMSNTPLNLSTPDSITPSSIDSILNPPNLATRYGLDDTWKPGTYQGKGAPSSTEQTSAGTKKSKRKPTSMRYAPAVGGLIGAVTTALTPVDKPDSSVADSILKARRDVRFRPSGDYLSYKPFDRDFYTNKLNAQAGATRRALADASSGNRAALTAALIGADYNAQNQLGDLFRQSEEYNQAQKERVAAFNKQTNQFNSEGDFRAQAANASSSLQAAAEAARYKAMEQARYRQQKQDKMSTIGANLTGLFDSIGDIGRENEQSNWIQQLIDSGVLYAPKSKGGKINRNKISIKI